MVLDTVSKIAMAQTIEEAWELGVRSLGAFGFDRINYGFTRFQHTDSIGDPDDALFLTNHSTDHVRSYFESGFFAEHPDVPLGARAMSAPARGAGPAERAPGRPAERRRAEGDGREPADRGPGRLFDQLRADLVAVERRDGLTARDDLTPGPGRRDLGRAHGDEILALCNTLHLKLTQLPYPVQRRALTERQREALEWVADGKTTQDIALLMDISSAMVEKHLRLAREALSVETTAQAVAKASVMNQIFVIGAGKGL